MGNFPPRIINDTGMDLPGHVKQVKPMKHLLEQMKFIMHDRLQRYGVTINEVLEVKSADEFYGLWFDHHKATVRMTEKTKNKLRDFLSLLEDEVIATRRQHLSLFGTLQYLSRVFRLPMYKFFYPMKFLSRRNTSQKKNREN